jgi:HSP20 family protein
MNALTRWDPVKERDDLHNRLARFFGLAPACATTSGQKLMTVAEWAPSQRWRAEGNSASKK